VPPEPKPPEPKPPDRKKLLLRLDPAVHDALARWAGDELRSTNAQIEFLLRRALADAGRLPDAVAVIRRPGRPTRRAARSGAHADHDSRSQNQTGAHESEG
jgi:hypothetical protein